MERDRVQKERAEREQAASADRLEHERQARVHFERELERRRRAVDAGDVVEQRRASGHRAGRDAVSRAATRGEMGGREATRGRPRRGPRSRP